MIKTKFLKKMLTCALTLTLVALPITASATTPGGTTPGTGGGNSSNESSSSGGSGGSSTYAPTPAAVASSSSVTVNGGKLVTTVPGQYYANNVAGVAVTTPIANVNAALGLAAGEKAQVRVYKSTCGKAAQECVNNAAAALGVPVGPTLDIFAGKVAGGKYSNIEKTAAPVQFAVGIPNNFKEAGMDYAIIRVEVGGTVTVLPDLDSDPNTVTFNTDSFGVFAFVKAPAGSFGALK